MTVPLAISLFLLAIVLGFAAMLWFEASPGRSKYDEY